MAAGEDGDEDLLDHPLLADDDLGQLVLEVVVGLGKVTGGLDVGLGASVWSSDLNAAREVASRIQAGTVWINKHGAVDPRVPFGGAKQSGYGLEFGAEGLKALGVPQVING